MHPQATRTSCSRPVPTPEAHALRPVQACTGRLGAAGLSPLEGAAPAARQSRFLGAPRFGVFVFLLGLLFGGLVHAGDAPSARVPKPVIEAARGGQCVEPAADMRRNHMEYLKHQRDDTMHGGVRGAKYSLKACIECHASQQTNSVTAAPTNFCISCHSYAAVKVDCFECHATQPGKATSSFYPLVHPSGAHAELSRQLRQLATAAPQAR